MLYVATILRRNYVYVKSTKVLIVVYDLKNQKTGTILTGSITAFYKFYYRYLLKTNNF